MKRFSSLVEEHYQQLETSGKKSELRDVLTAGWRVCLALTATAVDAVSASGSDASKELTSSSDGQWSIRQLAGDKARQVATDYYGYG